MENKCPVCGCAEVIEGSISGGRGDIVFLPYEQSGTIFLKSAKIRALACKKCGEVYRLTLTDKPNMLTDPNI